MQKQTLTFHIQGMDCAEETNALRRALLPLVGDESRLAFDLLNAELTVDFTGLEIKPDDIISAIKRTGMRAELRPEGDAACADGVCAVPTTNRGVQRLTVLTVISGVGGALGFILHAVLAGGVGAALGSEGMGVAESAPWPAMLAYLIGIAAGLWVVGPKAWYAAKSLRPDMNLLMFIAVAGAVAIGEWFEAATVAFLFSVSLLLESWSVSRARRAISALMDLAPPTARLLTDDGQEREIPAQQVQVGQQVVVRPGERIPVDGQVVRGASDVNQAPITGESVPVSKSPGSTVFAGTINGEGALVVECTKPAGDTTLARIIRLVGDAQARKAPSEKWVERFARYYTPAVMLLAILVLVVPPVLFHASWFDWIYRSLVLLVIACPCALVISTPVSVVAALAAAARRGVLVKGGEFIEAPAHLRAIAFDKTGTLTVGQPRVVAVIPLDGHSEEELLARAAGLESHSNHPLAQAILRAAEERGISPLDATDFSILPGKGARGRIDGREFWLGSHRYLEERGQETPEIHQRLEELQTAGRTVVVVGNERHVCGLIALADRPRDEAHETLRQLRELGIEHLVMLTGDNRGTAEAIARELEIDTVKAELLPEEKVRAVEESVQRYGPTAMVGDGINDAPALAVATLGIAMGVAGSDAAIETADVALMSDELEKLPWLVQHSRRTLRVIRQNITFALGVKALFVVLTFVGFASLWAAIAADMGASLLVISNGLRLLRQ
ncbi:MAG: cadmium transporter [Pirellulaceae bacterium]|nr:MAG: cadmium transporter [Pirellulaceae bacterium]